MKGGTNMEMVTQKSNESAVKHYPCAYVTLQAHWKIRLSEESYGLWPLTATLADTFTDRYGKSYVVNLYRKNFLQEEAIKAILEKKILEEITAVGDKEIAAHRAYYKHNTGVRVVDIASYDRNGYCTLLIEADRYVYLPSGDLSYLAGGQEVQDHITSFVREHLTSPWRDARTITISHFIP